VKLEVTRNYGETAAEKSNELLFHMLLAVISVSLLVAFVLGWREAGVVAVAIPVGVAVERPRVPWLNGPEDSWL